MNNFIFQNSTKVYFGKGCVKEYLTCLTKMRRPSCWPMAAAASSAMVSTMKSQAF